MGVSANISGTHVPEFSSQSNYCINTSTSSKAPVFSPGLERDPWVLSNISFPFYSFNILSFLVLLLPFQKFYRQFSVLTPLLEISGMVPALVTGHQLIYLDQFCIGPEVISTSSQVTIYPLLKFLH